MSRARLESTRSQTAGCYHCVSRIVNRRPLLGEAEREHFVLLMREYERFCGVRVLTYCVMSDHFHVLLEVPERPEVLPLGEDILVKSRRLTGHQNVRAIRERLEMYRDQGDEEGERAYLATFHVRMWSASEFMKTLKQRFTQWLNGRKHRRGTLWESRFKSVVVEGEGEALAVMGGYLDLNPVRAGLVQDPKDYGWSGYGAATAGNRRAQEGVRAMVAALRGGREVGLGSSLDAYREEVLYGHRGAGESGPGSVEWKSPLGRPARRLSLKEYLRCRVRYFSDGAVLGSREFVERWLQTNRALINPERKRGARRMRGLAGMELYTLRELQMDVFGHAGGLKGRVPPGRVRKARVKRSADPGT